ncbi:hypothetical protein [Nocardia sp. A7]
MAELVVAGLIWLAKPILLVLVLVLATWAGGCASRSTSPQSS